MALLFGRSYFCLKHLLQKPPVSCFVSALQNLQKSTNIDVIDAFTAELLEDRMFKWQMSRKITQESIDANKNAPKGNLQMVTRSVLTDYESVKNSDLWLDVRGLSEEQISSLLSTSIEINNNTDFIYLIKQCLKWKVSPSREVLHSCLEHLSLLAKPNLIEDLQTMYKDKGEKTSAHDYNEFEAYKALALWRDGNLSLSLSVLENCYQTSKGNFSSIRSAFKYISKDTLKSKSEAVLIQLVDTAESIYKGKQDIFIIGFIWKNCFQSDWYSDQQMAEKLFGKFEKLQEIVFKRTTLLCCQLLQENNADAVHRLIELFLRYENKDACRACLNALFEYNYWCRNLRACAEIIRNSLELDIPLSAAKSEKLINLLLNQDLKLRREANVEKFKYKF